MKFGVLKPKIDKRDYKLRSGVTELPLEYSCTDLPPAKNQLDVNSCVAHATSSILEYFTQKELGRHISLSTNFIYGIQGILFNQMEEGMYLRDACKIAAKYGDSLLVSIPGNTEQPQCTADLREKVNVTLYKEAFNFHINSYAQCEDDFAIKQAIYKHGPVLASVKWYERFDLDGNSLTFDTSAPFGLHAIVIYGWNKKDWLCLNSWGKNWGDKGHFLLPFGEDIEEVWSFVDADNTEDIVIPKNNFFLNLLYKLFNWLVNSIKTISEKTQ